MNLNHLKKDKMEKQQKYVIAKPKSKLLNKSLISYQFLPDLELINFAKEFSDNYKKLNIGEYCSNDNGYHIKYSDRIKDKSGKVLTTAARISDKTGIIELDKFIFKSKEYTPDFLFFIILWCVACNQQPDKTDMKMADKMAIEYYLTTGRSKKNLSMGYAKLFSKVPTQLNNERYKLIIKLLTNKKTKK